MSTLADVSPIPSIESTALEAGPRVTGVWQKIFLSAWAALFLLCLLNAVLSITTLNIWDSVPAEQAQGYFPNLPLSPEFVASKASFQKDIASTGISLAVFANILTVFRVLGSLPLFILSAMLVRRYPQRLMAVLFGMVLAVMGAAGIWDSPRFGWSVMLAPWMLEPVQALNLLLWFSLIFLYAFPNGRFTPRWTAALVVLLIPIVIGIVFAPPNFLNPATWPDPLRLLPRLVFIGVAFLSVLYRYGKAGPARRAQLRGFVVGISLLMIMYFGMFFLFDGYETLTGQAVFTNNQQFVLYVLIHEPIWYVLELVFVLGAARSIFNGGIFEG